MNEIILASKNKDVKGPSLDIHLDIFLSIVRMGVLCYDYIAKTSVVYNINVIIKN